MVSQVCGWTIHRHRNTAISVKAPFRTFEIKFNFKLALVFEDAFRFFRSCPSHFCVLQLDRKRTNIKLKEENQEIVEQVANGVEIA